MKKTISIIQSLMLLFVFGYCVVDMMAPEPLQGSILGLPDGVDPEKVQVIINNDLNDVELYNNSLAEMIKNPPILHWAKITDMNSVTTELFLDYGQVYSARVIIRTPDFKNLNNLEATHQL